MRPFSVALLLSLSPLGCGADGNYIGAASCGSCHKEIAASQMKSAMARTWQGATTPLLPAGYHGRAKEGASKPFEYEIDRQDHDLIFSAAMPNGVRTVLPVKIVMGGERHGLSFLLSIEKLAGIALERPALIEARYVYNSSNHALAISPGFGSGEPSSYEDAFGRVLSPGFEVKCLTCHVKPGTLGTDVHGGVQCESCHGPGRRHVEAIRQGKTGGVASSKTLEICAPCHSGFTERSDPLPNELLVSSQVVALGNSECVIQSGNGQSGNALTCTRCHDPHRDRTTAELEKASNAVCLSCHSSAVPSRAALCPVNTRDQCVGCHMPRVDEGVFHMSDHWIRVHTEQGIHAAKHDPSLRSQLVPLREFLRILVVDQSQKAESAATRLAQGMDFSDVARDLSMDQSAPGGGYIGEVWLSRMDPKLAAAAARLGFGETSGIIDLGNRWMMLQRMPRDFKTDADALFEEASALKAKGDIKGALTKNVEALKVYPYFLRALVFMGATLGENGDVQKGADVLAFAAQQYPKDASAQFDLGLTLGAAGNQAAEIQAFRRAIELDPDNIAVYENLGAALYSAGQWQRAIDVCHAGLKIDPLSAKLYFNLSLMLEQHGDAEGSKNARKLAAAIDPGILARQ